MAINKDTYLEAEKAIIGVLQTLNDERYLKKSDKASTAGGADSLTSSRNIITDLASTVAGSFNGTASIQAGVTGILPTTKGGTGNANGTVDKLTTARSLKVSLSSTSAPTFDGSANCTVIGVGGTLPIANGGTGQTTAAAARNALGLGNTTGALPVANGGTGQTALSAVTGVGSALAVSNTVTGSNSTNLVYAQIADNDYFRLRVGGTASNAGYVELATADDYNEPFYVRQYSGTFTTLKRTATLLDASGNTSFPGTVSAAAFSVPGGLAVANGGTGNTIGAAQQFVSLVSDSNSTFRNVWFGANASSLKAAYDSDFQYNPSTNILNVQNINGTSITISGGLTSGGTIKGAAVSVSGGLLGSSVSVSGGVTALGTLTGAAASLGTGGVITTGTLKGAAASVSGGVNAVGSVTGAGLSVSGGVLGSSVSVSSDISATNINATNLNVTNLVLSSTESEVDNALWIQWE